MTEKKVKSMGVLIAVVLILTIGLIGTTALNGKEMQMPLWVYDGEGTTTFYGLDAHIAETLQIATTYVSMVLTGEDEDLPYLEKLITKEPLGIAFTYNLKEGEVDKDYWQQIFEYLSHYEGVYWLGVNEDKTHDQHQVIYDLYQANKSTQSHWVVYPSTIEEVASAIQQDNKWLGIKLKTKEDLDFLGQIQVKYPNKAKILVEDYLQQPEWITNFYYGLQYLYLDVEMVYVKDAKAPREENVLNSYRQVLTLPWMGQNKISDRVVPIGYKQYNKQPLVLDSPTLLALPIQDNTIESIHYKLNGKTLGWHYRYPYAQKMVPEQFYQGNNELRVVIQYKDKTHYVVHKYFLQGTKPQEVDERQSRTTPTYSIEKQPTYKTKTIPVLMYHKFKDQVEPTPEDQSMSVSVALFKDHIETLAKKGYTPIDFKNLQDYLKGVGGLPEKPYIITADDGYLDNYTHAYPILKQYGVPATFFVTPQYVGVTTAHEHFDWEQAREMEASGLVDIQSHSYAHALLNEVSEDELNFEVHVSFGRIQKELGKRDVKVLAYPQFRHNKKTVQHLKAWGVDLQVTRLLRGKQKTTATDIRRIHVHNELTSQELIKRIQSFTE